MGGEEKTNIKSTTTDEVDSNVNDKGGTLMKKKQKTNEGNDDQV